MRSGVSGTDTGNPKGMLQCSFLPMAAGASQHDEIAASGLFQSGQYLSHREITNESVRSQPVINGTGHFNADDDGTGKISDPDGLIASSPDHPRFSCKIRSPDATVRSPGSSYSDHNLLKDTYLGWSKGPIFFKNELLELKSQDILTIMNNSE